MIVFFYEKVRLKRGVWQTVSIVLLIAFLCAFFTLFDGFICQKEQDMESAYAVIPVTVVVSNLTGTKTDDLKITDYIINYFLSDKYAYGGELQEKAFSSYVKDVCLKASVYYSQGTGFSSRQKLIGITSVDAASELAPVSGNSITYFEGYDESIFTSNKAACLVSTAAAEELSQDTDSLLRPVKLPHRFRSKLLGRIRRNLKRSIAHSAALPQYKQSWMGRLRGIA